MKIIVRDNLGKDVTHKREWYINTDGKIFYYTGDIDGPLYVVDNDYTWEVEQYPMDDNWFEDYGKRFLEVNGYDYPDFVQPADTCMANNAGGYVYTISTKSPDAFTSTANIDEAVKRIEKYLKR